MDANITVEITALSKLFSVYYILSSEWVNKGEILDTTF